ncbi:MAG: asparagine synthase [Chromatiaceae bacterium]|nr:asparagine synthase [Chromatiaceae bacterium]
MALTERQHPDAGLWMLAAVDGVHARLSSLDQGFEIVDSGLIQASNDGQGLLIRVSYSAYQGRLRIENRALSGKAIYYRLKDGEFHCATQLSLLRALGVPIEENSAVLPEFFVYRYVMPPATLYQDIFLVPAGGWIDIYLKDRQGLQLQVQPFKPPAPGPRELTKKASARRIEAVLEQLSDGIRLLLPEREQVAFMLSGGLDSSILFRLGQMAWGCNESWSSGYPFERVDQNLEKAYALSAAEMFDSHHHYHEPSLEAYLKGLIEAIAIAESPVHHLQSVLLFLLFRDGIPAEKRILVSGEGADGFFGLPAHARLHQCRKSTRWLPVSAPAQALHRLVQRLAAYSWRARQWRDCLDLRMASALPLDADQHALYRLGAYGSKAWVRQYFGVTDRDIVMSRVAFTSGLDGYSINDMMSLLDFSGEIVTTQAIWSKLAEHQGKRLHYLFTHERLIQLAFELDWNTKLERPKYVLRKIAERIGVPDSIVNRPKASFGISASRWGGRNGIFQPLLPLIEGAVEADLVRSLDGTEGEDAMLLWNVLNYALWKRLCIGGESLDDVLLECSESCSSLSANPVHSGQGASA